MQCARAVLSSVACRALQFFPPNYPIQRARFSGGGKKIMEHKMCFDFPYNFCVTHRFLMITERDTVITYTGHHVKCPLFLSDVNET